MAEFRDQSSPMPEQYAAKLQQARALRAMQGERRIITLLFCDVTGSTAIAEKLDPEEWAEIMNEAFQYMIAPVYTYEGTVARLMGDAVLAFFGAPIAHEDDPQRAVLAGLDIVTGIEKFASEIRRTYGLDFNVRVGINTGPVVVGEIGADLAVEYTAMGDAVNLAARMEQTAEPGTVQIAENTYHLVEPFFKLAPLGELEVKGKEKPVAAYRVDGIASEPGTLRGIEGIDSPLVGRETELDQMRRLIASLAEGGPGHILFLLGEAGLGKSRLVDELRDHWLATRQQTPDGWDHWNQMAAVSYGASIPYGMIKHALRVSCHITESDSPEQARGKLAHTMKGYPPDLQERLNQLYTILLGIDDGQSGLRPEGEDFKRELFSAVLQATRLRAAGAPTVIVGEDMHWSDSASLEQHEHLLQSIDDQPILFIGVMRPERDTPAWQMKERVAARYPGQVSEIHLHPLSEDESADLVDGLLPVQDMPRDVCEMILERTDGNPFFIEEVIRTLLESGTLERTNGALHWNSSQSAAQLVIPGNVQALLAARIDRLEKEARHTLQLASVIGRNFYRRVLDMISETAEALDQQLKELEALALIREAARLPELEYMFRHALTRDATYATILRRRRRAFHRRVGEAFELLFPDRLHEEASRLAEHFNEALVLDKAQHYYTMAGDQALRLYANREASDFYSKALNIARESGTVDQLGRLYRKLSRAYELSGRYDDALDLFQEMHQQAARRAAPAIELQALLSEATIRSTFTDKFDTERGHQLVTEALALAQELGDPRAESKAYWNLSLLGTYSDRGVYQTIEYGEKAATIARQNGLHEELAYALHDLARPYFMAGRLSDSLLALDEAAQLWRDLGRSNMLADNRATLAEGLNMLGQLEQSLLMGQEALAISRKTSNAWGQAYALGSIAPVLYELGRIDEAFDAWHESLVMARKANFGAPRLYARAHMALALAQLGDLDSAFAQLNRAKAAASNVDLPIFSNLPQFGLAHLHLLAGNLEEARRALPDKANRLELARSEPILLIFAVATFLLLSKADQDYDEMLSAAEQELDLAREGDIALVLPDLQLLQAEALLGLDRLDEAATILYDALEHARSFSARVKLANLLALIMKVEHLRGNETAAAEAREEGLAAVAFIAEHISDPELHEKYMRTDMVRSFQEAIE